MGERAFSRGIIVGCWRGLEGEDRRAIVYERSFSIHSGLGTRPRMHIYIVKSVSVQI